MGLVEEKKKKKKRSESETATDGGVGRYSCSFIGAKAI